MTKLPVWADRLTLPSDAANTGKPTAFYPVAITGGTIYLPGTVLMDDAGNSIDSGVAALAGTERGIVTRNLLQGIGNTPIAAKTLPVGADGQTALPVEVNSQQYATYIASIRAVTSGALTANTAKAIVSLEHAASAVKRVKIRRVLVTGYGTDAVFGMVDVQVTRGTAASSAGAAITPVPTNPADAAAETTVKSLPTITAATVLANIPWGVKAAAANSVLPSTVLYDWQESGQTKPMLLRPGVLDTLVFNVISNAANTIVMTLYIVFTEES